MLGNDRAEALGELQAVDELLGTHLASLHLAQPPAIASPR